MVYLDHVIDVFLTFWISYRRISTVDTQTVNKGSLSTSQATFVVICCLDFSRSDWYKMKSSFIFISWWLRMLSIFSAVLSNFLFHLLWPGCLVPSQDSFVSWCLVFFFRKGQASQGYQPNMAYQVIIRLGTYPRIKVGWGDPVRGKGSQKETKELDTFPAPTVRYTTGTPGYIAITFMQRM